MSEETQGSPTGALSLPDNPNLDWLRKQAKRRLDELQVGNPTAQLADAQFELAKQYGFASWRALKAHIDALTVDGQLFDAAEKGDTERLGALLDTHPDKLYVRKPPYEWTLLHVAAHNGRLAVVNLLLGRGFDVNTREKGDDTYAMHWAAAAGHVDVVRRLADAGGDVVGHGDDHELEVIGWATCWDGSDDDAHRAVVDVLVSARRSAPHLLGHRDAAGGRGPAHCGSRPVSAESAHEPQREQPDATALRGAHESPRHGRAAAGARRGPVGGRRRRVTRPRCTRRRRTRTGK